MDRTHNGKIYAPDELEPVYQQNNYKLSPELAIKLRSGDAAEPEDWQKSFFSMQINRSIKSKPKSLVYSRAIMLYAVAAVIAASAFIGGLTVYGYVRLIMAALVAVITFLSNRREQEGEKNISAADEKNFIFYTYTAEDKFMVRDNEDRHFLVLAGVNVLVDKELYDSCDFDDILIGAVAPTSDGFYFSVNKF